MMEKSEIILIMMILLLVFPTLGINLHLSLSNTIAYAQPAQDKTSSELERLGTYNILYFPDNVSIIYGNHQNASMDQEFILLGGNAKTPGHYQVALSDADYGLPPQSVNSIASLTSGKNITIDSTTDSDIRYSLASVSLVPITSPFPPEGTNIQDIDPEGDLTLSKPINLGTYTGDSGSFVVPQTTGTGYYMIYTYLKYPAYNMTAVYDTIVHVTGGSSSPSSSTTAGSSNTSNSSDAGSIASGNNTSHKIVTEVLQQQKKA